MARSSKNKAGSLVGGVVFIIIGIVWCILNIPSIKAIGGSSMKLNDHLTESIATGTRVTLDVDAAIDWYATLEHKTNGVKTGEDYYAMIWLDDSTFMGLKVKKADYDKLENIMDKTWEYVEGTSNSLPTAITFEGTLKKMESKEEGFFKDALDQLGYSSEDYSTVARFYTIDTTVTKGSGILAIVITLVLIAVGVFQIIGAAKMNKKMDEAAVVNPNEFNPYAENTPNPYAEEPNQEEPAKIPFPSESNPYGQQNVNPYAEQSTDPFANNTNGGYTLNGEQQDNNNF